MTSEIVALLVTAFVAIGFLALYLLPQRRTAAERGLVARYTGRCAVFRGEGRMLFGGIPSQRVTIYDDFMVIRGVGAMVVRYSEVVEIDARPDWVTGRIAVTTRKQSFSIVSPERAKVIDALAGTRARLTMHVR